ncbi:flagellar basal body P-ring protein FlgI [Aquabacterium sp. A7-Y]|uniref:flagellar basal body P-ring protein FlgI n=1 Tax=Aquabacterium sp. A7-Y TaxID=1349605 RepID=UPI00223D0B48|nr:flagellar basal body P-ring protein FlgI [Aquabacterium sp. A7-Y]MCW7540879.1 flagellar basal body P-ring protein FlgI [Aquabacterium sp. A7-Y]
MYRAFCFTLLVAGALGFAGTASAAGVRIKDIARVQSDRQHALVGYGLVTGLAGTGDSPANRATRQSLANLLSQFNVTLPPDAVNSRNVAAVMVSGSLPNFGRPGDTVDVTVTSIGDARSLVGGNLLLTPLNGPDGKTYVLAQGGLTVGGYRYEANGTMGQKNHPTVATIPGGGTIEVAPPAPDTAQVARFSVSLMEADYTNAARIAEAINAGLGGGYAKARDPDTVSVTVPDGYRGRFVELMQRIEALEIAPDLRARVVVNERTGTVVAGANVRVAPTAITYGDLRISIVTDNAVSQPGLLRNPTEAIRTESYANSRIDLQEPGGATLVTQPGGTIADLVQALASLRTSARDVVSVLKALKASGALHAELIVQ